MCLGQCEPFEMTGKAATNFDRDLLSEYNQELGGVLIVEDNGDKIVVSFPEDMDASDKNNAHLVLEELFGFD